MPAERRAALLAYHAAYALCTLVSRIYSDIISRKVLNASHELSEQTGSQPHRPTIAAIIAAQTTAAANIAAAEGNPAAPVALPTVPA